MIICYSEQDTEQWSRDRMSIPSASCFNKIMTPKGGKSSQSGDYMNMLLAEWLIDKPLPNKSFGWMKHGTETENEARSMYEFISGNEVVSVGFIYKNAGRLIGCSPDGLLTSKRRGVEIKCPAPHTHVSYLVGDCLPKEYKHQVQGSMYITGYDTWDFFSYHPEFPPLLVTVERDESYIANLNKLTVDFVSEMIDKRKKLMRYKK